MQGGLQDQRASVPVSGEAAEMAAAIAARYANREQNMRAFLEATASLDRHWRRLRQWRGVGVAKTRPRV